MTIWLLALLLLASLAGLGFRQGAIRVGFSFFGIILGALLAPPLGRLLKPLLVGVGLKNPAYSWVVGPLIVFILFSIAFKIAGLAVHQKIDVFYKYKAGDLRLALWERLNRRLGLCLGLLNGTAYLILISFLIYSFSYWTVQMASSDSDPKNSDPTTLQILNRMGRDLQATGFYKVATSISKFSPSFYNAADVTGLLYQNSLMEARLARYPGLLGLAERPEFQDLANDTQFTQMRLERKPIMAIIKHPKVEGILNNHETMKTIWSTIEPDLKDLAAFLETGRSAKYDSEKILGRWNFDVNSIMAAIRQKQPNLTSSQMQKLKKPMVAAFMKTMLVAVPNRQAILKNFPRNPTAPGETQTVQGKWEGAEGKYILNFSGNLGEIPASVEGDRLTVTGGASLGGMNLAFTREN
ncbi:MAG TPA: CvpA family protein [Candidatus Eisenbacteria bacterium]|nr:CvpA family protein [Candidatus Eisenbacteria bacterium]